MNREQSRRMLGKAARLTMGREYPILPSGEWDRLYPLDWRRWAAEPDPDGAVRADDGCGGRYVHPVATAFRGLADIHAIHLGGATYPLQQRLSSTVEALLNAQQIDGSWRYPVPVPRYAALPGWSSGMAQGLVTSLLVRAEPFLSDKCRDRSRLAAEHAIAHMLMPVIQGGCAVLDSNGKPFLEECPSEPPPFILNGACFALLGLHDYEDRAGGTSARAAAERLHCLLHRWDLGYWSRYDLLSTAPSSPDYHRLHISLLTVLGERHPDLSFSTRAARFEDYRASMPRRARALSSLITERLVLPAPQGRLPMPLLRLVAPRSSAHTKAWLAAFRAEGWNVSLWSLTRRDDARLYITLPLTVLRGWISPERANVTAVQTLGTHGLLGLLLPPRGRMVVVPWGSEVQAARRSRWRWAVASRLLRRADTVLTTSQSMAEEIQRTWAVPPVKIITISWGVDDDFLAGGWSRESVGPLRTELGFTEDDVVVLAPRGPDRVYRCAEILQAFTRARSKRHNLRLVITGIERADQRETVGLGKDVPPGVTVLGHLDADRLARLYRASDVVVSIPVDDQRSTSVLEAIASGAHLLLAPLAAYQEIQQDGATVELLDLPVEQSLQRSLQLAVRRRDAVASANREWALQHERRQECFRRVVQACAGETLA